MIFRPATGHVEIEPLKTEGVIITPDKQYEEVGRVIATTYTDINVGDIIFFDAWSCRATPEYEGKKHYVVDIAGGGLIGKLSDEERIDLPEDGVAT